MIQQIKQHKRLARVNAQMKDKDGSQETREHEGDTYRFFIH